MGQQWDIPYFDVGIMLIVMHVLLASWAVVHALLFKSDSRSAFGWIGMVIVFPVAGPLLYLTFGINRVRRKAQRATMRNLPWTDQGILPALPKIEPGTQDALTMVGSRISGEGLTENNSVTTLYNGEQAFPAMLQAINAAQREVLLATYIFDTDQTGQNFVTALRAAQERGATVKVLLDDVGRHYAFPSILRRLRKANITVRRFSPLSLLFGSFSLNLRNHRKILVTDGEIAFAGGMNIGDRQLAQGKSKHRTTDLHFEFRGPIVHKLRALFEDDWAASGGEAATVPAPASSNAGSDCACRLIADGPDASMNHLEMLILGVVSAAQSRVWIMNPYFVPDSRLISSLQSAALRGVDVRVIVPAKNNWPPVRWALSHIVAELISAGVEVYEQPPPFAHSKCMLIDDNYALVGSLNLDPRSLRLNYELGVEIFSAQLNENLSQHFNKVLPVSALITKKRLRNQSIAVRLRNSVAALFSPYL